MTPAGRPRLAVVGAGWAGLAAAVRGVQQGWQVQVFDMAGHAGGRARSVALPSRTSDALGSAPTEVPDAMAGQGAEVVVDNGQHILIGAYTRTLDLMATVGVDPQAVLMRRPLVLAYPDGSGLRLPAGPPWLAFARGVLAAGGWTRRDKAALLLAAGRWLAKGFRCDPAWTVARLCQRLPQRIQQALIDPLCVAALNTPMADASASVFLRVMKDALFAGAGSADLLLPRQPLSALLPAPAQAWLHQQGAVVSLGHRVQMLAPDGPDWQVDGSTFDAVVLACSAPEAARLTAAIQPGWSAHAAALAYQPIITAYLHDPHLHLPEPMLALRAGPQDPAQFIFDLDALGLAPGRFALVVSGAADALSGGLASAGQLLLGQARRTFPGHFIDDDALRHISAERRATFACTPALPRPLTRIADRLVAAGDYISGPYPATLEGAVRAGEAAIAALIPLTASAPRA